MPRFSFTSVIIGFDFRCFFPRNICLGFRRSPRISWTCPRDLAANFAKTNGEEANSDKTEVEKFVSESKINRCVEIERLIPQQVFNCGETGLFLRKMPKRMFVTQEEKALQGHKPMKNSLTLLFCVNASGDCNVKPLLLYNSETRNSSNV
ncbi:hypothetical protein AVEN_141195-1 [Araneus ventricosus]|uniref:DDE-1 domain-containing protein n=1 Tax=Araneus ventricosus TaxID=182803 RepID=A0A4Y2ESM0_ARAVE|nr:hypothetical protein AVEN_141195-1 [Araneus ventricosus]